MRIDIEHTATVCDCIEPEWETAFAASALAWTAFLGG